MASPPLSLTIRFSSSQPDLPLIIAIPTQTSILSLILQIRSALPPTSTDTTSRIRLIYSGRILPLTSSVLAAFRLPPPPPRNRQPGNNEETDRKDIKGKGKAPARDHDADDTAQRYPPNIYIHAHFSEPLSATALEEERLAASDADVALQPHASPPLSPTSPSAGPSSRPGRTRSVAAPLPPQGFDRLLSAGLSPLEVASLRSQFVARLAHTHTPDTMPSAAELRMLEERWLDEDHSGGPANIGAAGGDTDADAGTGEQTRAGGLLGGARRMLGLGGGGNTVGGGAAGGAGILSDQDSGGLEDMLWGNVMGFFWPVAAVVWLMREDGVWTHRRGVAVVTGALVNFAFGVTRAAG